MRSFAAALASVALAVLVLLPSCVPAVAARLNVLLIVADDLRPELGCYGGQAISPNLDRLASSDGSVVFDRAYVQQAICCPTRSSFLTGRRPDTTLVWDLKTQFRDAPGASNWTTLPQAFRDRGYWTAGMGKVFHPVKYEGKSDDVAGGSWSQAYYQPSCCNASTATATATAGTASAAAARPAGACPPGEPAMPCEDTAHPLEATNCGLAAPNNVDTDYTDGRTAVHAVATLRNVSVAAKDPANPTPFFVAVGFHRPHLPWVTPSKYFDLYNATTITLADHNTRPANYNVTGAQPWSWDPESGPRHCMPLNNKTAYPGEYDYVPDAVALHFRKSYYAAVSQLDHNVGVVLAELEALELQASTVIAFVGDHGWQLGDLGEFGKKTNFERATRAPFIIHDPTSTNKAATSSALVEFVDLMPTLMSLALGAAATPPLCPAVTSTSPTQPSLCTEGQSLAGVMADPLGTKNSRPAAFMQYAHCMHDEPGYEWHDGCDNPAEPRVMGYAIRTRRWRYIEWVRFNKTTTPPTPYWDQVLGTELYDHTETDTVENVAESVNVVAEPEREADVARLSRQLRAGWRAVL